MIDLVIQFKTPLKHPNHHIRYQTNSVLDGDRFSPGWRPLLGIAKAGHDHVMKGIIRKVSAIVVNNFARTDAPSPDLIFHRAIQKAILVPTEMHLLRSTHLDPPFDHMIYNLSRD